MTRSPKQGADGQNSALELKDDVEGGELERPGEAVARDPQRRQAGQWGAYYHFFQVFAATFKVGKTITTQEQMTA
jgi:hypothetical protein